MWERGRCVAVEIQRFLPSVPISESSIIYLMRLLDVADRENLDSANLPQEVPRAIAPLTLRCERCCSSSDLAKRPSPTELSDELVCDSARVPVLDWQDSNGITAG